MAGTAHVERRIRHLCAAEPDSRVLRLGVLDALRTAVGFDAYAWLLTDPVTSVGSAPLADVPCLPELPSLIRLKYLTPVNRWTRLREPAATLVEATDGDLSRSLVWRKLLGRHGVTDVASAVFRDRFGCWGFLDLWRIGRAPFTPDETRLVAGIVEPVTTALRRSEARTFRGPVTGVAAPPGPVVLLLSPDLAVRAQTAQTQQYLRLLVPPDRDDAPPVPAGAYNVAAQLLANETGIDHQPALARVHLRGGTWLKLQAARMDATRSATSDIAISIEPAAPADRIAVFARAYALSARERELLHHLAAGSDTGRIAAALFLSEYTVQDHLKSIFAKTGTRSRRELLAHALGS